VKVDSGQWTADGQTVVLLYYTTSTTCACVFGLIIYPNRQKVNAFSA